MNIRFNNVASDEMIDVNAKDNIVASNDLLKPTCAISRLDFDFFPRHENTIPKAPT